MSNIVRKGDFLVFVDAFEQVSEFFISSINIDLDNCRTGSTGRKKVHGCFGFQLRNGHYYEPGEDYWITRKATLEERDRFLRWLEEKGHKVNLNTMEITLNR